MVRLSGRVRSLERRSGVNAPCRRCGGLGLPGVALEIDGEPTRGPRGCPDCGRLSSLKRIMLTSGGDPALAAEMRAAWPAPPVQQGTGTRP